MIGKCDNGVKIAFSIFICLPNHRYRLLWYNFVVRNWYYLSTPHMTMLNSSYYERGKIKLKRKIIGLSRILGTYNIFLFQSDSFKLFFDKINNYLIYSTMYSHYKVKVLWISKLCKFCSVYGYCIYRKKTIFWSK